MPTPSGPTDLHTEAARQHAALFTAPDLAAVGQTMDARSNTPHDGPTWHHLDEPAFDTAQQQVHDLITGAANLSQWAVSLGADGLEPAGHTVELGTTTTSDGQEAPFVRMHFAFHPDTTDAERDQFVLNLATGKTPQGPPTSTAPLAAGLPLVQGSCPACRGASLFLGDGGYATCSRIDCPEPDAASTLLEPPAGSPLHTVVAGAIRDCPSTVPEDIATAVIRLLQPGARITAALARHSEATVQRTTDLYERWVKAGPPPLGTSLARWWDQRLVELRAAILPADEPAPATTRQAEACTNCRGSGHDPRFLCPDCIPTPGMRQDRAQP